MLAGNMSSSPPNQSVVADVMTSEPAYVHPNVTVSEIKRMLRSLDTHHLPVAAGGLLIGIISTSDLLRDGDTAEDIMTPDPLTCRVDEPVVLVAARMGVHRVRALPVVNGGKLIGIVTTFDMLDALVAVLQDDVKLP